MRETSGPGGGKTSNKTAENPRTFKGTESPSEITAERAAPVRPSQDTRTAPVHPVENGERQFPDQVKNLAREKSLPRDGRPTEPLRAELYDGIYRKKIENVFFDLRREPFAEQLRGCIREATTYLVMNRTGKTMELRAEDIETRALEKFALSHATLAAVQDFSHRQRLVTQLVARVVAETAAEMLEANGQGAAEHPPGTSAARPLQVAV